MAYYPHKSWPGWWTIDFYPNGRAGVMIDGKLVTRIREHMEGTEEEADEYERRLRGLHVSKCQTAKNPSFKDIAKDFKKWAATNRSENYTRSIGWNLKNLLPVFGLFPPSRITYMMTESYKKSRKETPRACNQELEMLTIIINWGADPKRGYCQKLPFAVEKLKVFRKLPEPPAPEEFNALLCQVQDNFKQARQTPEQQIHKVAMMLIMYECGIRWIECRNLQWEHARKADGRLYLGRTKNNEARYTFIPPDVLEMLKPIWQEEGFMFVNPRTDKPYTTMGKSLRSSAKKVGVKLRGTHTLRHALGTDMMDATDDIRGVQVSLGHADIKTSTLYTKTATGRIKRLLSEVREYRKPTPLVYVDKTEPEYCI